jgi:effector-binding domain-containing protein
MERAGVKASGPALSVYYTYAPDRLSFRAGFIVAQSDLGRSADPVKADVTPAVKVIRFVHKGSYSTLRDDYARMMDYAKKNGLVISAPTWEVYLNDPETVPEADLLTEVFVALA